MLFGLFSRRARPAIKISGNTIIISGIQVHDLMRDISTYWSTRKMELHMFSYARATELGFSQFFALEILYMVRSLIQHRYNRIPVSVYREIEELLLKETWVGNVDRTFSSSLDMSKLSQFNYTPLKDQQAFFDHMRTATARMGLRGYLLDAEPGTGKAQPLTAKLRKADQSFLLMGDAKVGDAVLTEDGTETNILAIYPQGKRLVYWVECVDGRRTSACAEHLWRAYHGSEPRGASFTTAALKSLIESGQGKGLALPVHTVKNALERGYALLKDIPKDAIAGDIKTTCIIDCIGKPEAQALQAEFWALGYLAYLHEKRGVWRVRTRRFQPDETPKVEIRSITPGRVVETQCIRVAHPSSLYVVDDWVTTHNTYMSLALSAMQSVDTTIVVVPKRAVDDPWRSELETLYKAGVREAWYSDTQASLDIKPGVFVVHYDYLSKFLEAIKQVDPKTLGRIMVILDESHNMNEVGRGSDRTQYFIDLCAYLSESFVLWMSGTPVKSMGREIIPMLKTIDPLFDSTAEARFRKIFQGSTSRANDIVAHRLGLIRFTITKANSVPTEPIELELEASIPDSQNYTLDSIRSEIRLYTAERNAYYDAHGKVLIQQYFELIERVRSRKPYLSDQIDAYLRVAKILHESYDPKIHKSEPKYCSDFERKTLIPELDGTEKHAFRDVRSVYKYVSLKIMGEALGRIVGARRRECAEALAQLDVVYRLRKGSGEHLERRDYTIADIIRGAEAKSLLFTYYVPVVTQLYQSLNEQNIRTFGVHAGTTSEIPKYRRALETEPDALAIVSTFESLSTAVRLPMCSCVVLLNQPFREFERKQSIARAWRLGNPNQVEIWNLYLDTGGKDNISTRSQDILEWNREQVAEIMGVDASTSSLEAFDAPSYSPGRDDALKLYDYAPLREVVVDELRTVNTQTAAPVGKPNYLYQPLSVMTESLDALDRW